MGIVTVLWALVGFSIAFAPNTSTGIVGNLAYAPLNKINPYTPAIIGINSAPLTISLYTYSMFQLM
jgi:Amt family ammonium transporter